MSSILAENRRARFDYDILETLEAGLDLLGSEVKSIRSGRLNISGSYVLLRGNELWLINADIPPYQPQNSPPDYDPVRARRVLLHREEIAGVAGKLKEKGLNLIPLRAYSKRGLIKLELGLARIRKKSDKREALKKRVSDREIRRAQTDS